MDGAGQPGLDAPAADLTNGTALAPEAQSQPSAPVPDEQQIAEMTRLAQEALGAMSRGISGWDYAEGLHVIRGELFLRQVQGYGAENLVTALLSFPGVQSLRNHIARWVAEFCAYDPSGPDESGPDEIEDMNGSTEQEQPQQATPVAPSSGGETAAKSRKATGTSKGVAAA